MLKETLYFEAVIVGFRQAFLAFGVGLK